MHCYLCSVALEEHKLAPPNYTKKFVRIGKLFGGAPLCTWCALHLDDLTKPCLTTWDETHLKQMKERFPNYWRVIEKEGLEKVRREVSMEWFDAEPDSTPKRPEQMENYPKLEVTVQGTRGGTYGS